MKKLLMLNMIFTLIVGGTIIYQGGSDNTKYVAEHVVKLEDETGSGTGFYLMYKDKSYLITNKHVCGSKKGFMTNDGYSKIITVSKDHDLCLLDSKRLDGLSISHKKLSSLDKVLVVGHPVGNPITAREGRYVSDLLERFPWVSADPVNTIHVSVTAFSGSSGSPITDLDGDVVGVLFSVNARTFHDSYGVPVEDLVMFLEELI